MKFVVTIDRDEDGVWIVECPSIPGCVSQGKTKQEALASVQEAIRLCLEVRVERGLPLTVETREVEVTAPWEVFLRGVNDLSADFLAEGRLQPAVQQRPAE